MLNSIILISFGLFVVVFCAVSILVVFGRKNIIGKNPINKFIFITGKFALFATWTLIVAHAMKKLILQDNPELYFGWFGVSVYLVGILFASISIINMGNSIAMGTVYSRTKLKTNGLYAISRNPMYIGFNLMSLGGAIYTFNYVLFILAIYTIVVHHLIIIAEEKHLLQIFGKDWIDYSIKVGRYL